MSNRIAEMRSMMLTSNKQHFDRDSRMVEIIRALLQHPPWISSAVRRKLLSRIKYV